MVDTTILNKLGLIYKFLSDNSLIAMVLLLIAVIIMDLLFHISLQISLIALLKKILIYMA